MVASTTRWRTARNSRRGPPRTGQPRPQPRRARRAPSPAVMPMPRRIPPGDRLRRPDRPPPGNWTDRLRATTGTQTPRCRPLSGRSGARTAPCKGFPAQDSRDALKPAQGPRTAIRHGHGAQHDRGSHRSTVADKSLRTIHRGASPSGVRGRNRGDHPTCASESPANSHLPGLRPNGERGHGHYVRAPVSLRPYV